MILEGNAATEAIMCMREGIWWREGILGRLKRSRLSNRLRAAVVAADNALYETENAMGRFWEDGSEEFGAILLRQHSEFLRLAGLGWGTLAFMGEGERYEPKIIYAANERLGFYNPSTGEYDLFQDAGWEKCGLPQRKKSR
ncbi:MAG: hypothetical protein KDK75_08925 [Alphaproteobacteria bacterium]|nr:hypothetical protein [Alphaproteobacteria bacterium]